MRWVLFFAICLELVQAHAQGQKTFQTFWNYNSVSNKANDLANDFIEMSDSNFFIPFTCLNLYKEDTLGYAKTYFAYCFLSKSGVVLDTFQFSIKGNSINTWLIEQFNDSTDYLIIGNITNLVKLVRDTIGTDLLLVKVNQHGDTLWTKTISFSDGDELPDQLIKTRDGGFAVIGQSCDKLETNCDMFLLKLDSNANEEWHRTYAWDEQSWEYPTKMTELQQGGYILSAGITKLTNNDTLNPLVICTDALGNERWKRRFPNEGKTYAYFDDVQQKENNVILLCGTIGNDKLWEDERFGWIVQIDANGIIVRNKKIGVPNRETTFQNLSMIGENYYVQGYSDAYSVDRRNVNFLYSLNIDFSIKWLHTYQDSLTTNQTYVIYNLKPTADGGFGMIGFGDDPKRAGNNQDVWFLKVDSNGCLYQPCLSVGLEQQAPKEEMEVTIFPQPAKENFQIETAFDYDQIELVHMNGVSIGSWKKQEEYTLPAIAPGVYLLRFTNSNGKEITSKLMVGE